MARALEQLELGLRRAHSPDAVEPDVDLLVAHTPQLDPRALTPLRGLKRERHDLQIIVVCDEASLRTARRAVDAGINGLLLTVQIETALGPTVGAVLAGQTVVPSEFKVSLRKPSLSFREKQILGLVMLGFTNGQIGSRLFLAESTVKSHLSSSFTKLGVASRSEAAALILDPQEPLGVGIMRIAEQFQASDGLVPDRRLSSA